jgi:hypothetical protein
MYESMNIRMAYPDDERALSRLATLDARPVPSGPVLVAEVEGELWAALSLTGGAAVADPFRPTAALVELLRARRAQLAPSTSRLGRRRRRRAARGVALGSA